MGKTEKRRRRGWWLASVTWVAAMAALIVAIVSPEGRGEAMAFVLYVLGLTLAVLAVHLLVRVERIAHRAARPYLVRLPPDLWPSPEAGDWFELGRRP